MIPYFSRKLLVLSLTAFLGYVPAFVRAQDAARDLDHIVQAYSNLKSYGDEGEVQVVQVDGKTSTPQASKTFFQRPGNLKVEAEDVRLSITGSKMTTVLDTLRTTMAVEVQELPQADTLLVGPLGASLLGSAKGQPQAILLHLLLDQKPAEWLKREGKLVQEQPQKWAGQSWNRLRIDRPLRPDWLLWYDSKTGLIGRIDVASGDPEKVTVGVLWASGKIRTEPLDQSVWSLDVPANYSSVDKKVEAFQKAATEKKKTPESELVGKVLEDFPLVLIESDGQTKQVKISDFKGKPILLDFWATWCGPCRKSFPELTQALATVDGKSDLKVILVSIDQKADEGELTEFVRLGLKKMGVDLEKVPLASLALDQIGAASKSLNVEAIPMTVLIDRAGKIRKVHVGVTPATTLRKDLADLLK